MKISRGKDGNPASGPLAYRFVPSGTTGSRHSRSFRGGKGTALDPNLSLRFYLNTEQGRLVLAAGQAVPLRRSTEAGELVLHDPSVSRGPAGIGVFRRDGEQVLFEPAGDGTPVLLNGAKITQATPVQPGDRLRVGYSVIVVQAIEADDGEGFHTVNLETTYVQGREQLGQEAQRLAEWSEGFDTIRAAKNDRELAEAILGQLSRLGQGDRGLIALTGKEGACREMAACGLHANEVEAVLRWCNEHPPAAGASTPLIQEVLHSGTPGRAAVGRVDVEERSWLFYLEPTARGPILQNAHRAVAVFGNLLQLSALFRERQDQKRWTDELVQAVKVHTRAPDDQVYQTVRERFIFASSAMQTVCRSLARAAAASCPVLLLGEPGTGKELAAEAIHRGSTRRHKELVSVNLTECPDTLVEGLLFGHVRGAFTGATGAQVGLVAHAHRSTLFLDEIGEIPLPIQAKLLRVLERGEFRRLGEHQLTKVDVRIVAATNRDLSSEVRAGRFRQDLFDRLNVITIVIPPLRDRLDDLAPLAAHFLAQINAREGRDIALADSGVRHLRRYNWPDNVRGLRNYLEKAVALTDRRVLDADSLPPFAAPTLAPAAGAMPADEVDDLIEELRGRSRMNQARILGVFRESNQHWGKSELAERLNLSRPVCRTELQQLIAYALDRGFSLGYFEERISLRPEDWDKITRLRKESV